MSIWKRRRCLCKKKLVQDDGQTLRRILHRLVQTEQRESPFSCGRGFFKRVTMTAVWGVWNLSDRSSLVLTLTLAKHGYDGERTNGIGVETIENSRQEKKRLWFMIDLSGRPERAKREQRNWSWRDQRGYRLMNDRELEPGKHWEAEEWRRRRQTTKEQKSNTWKSQMAITLSITIATASNQDQSP